MVFSGTRAGFAAFWTTVFIFVVFGKKIRKRSLISGITEDSASFVLRLRCYKSVKKSWSTANMNDKMCCLVLTFSAKMSTRKARKRKQQ